MVMLGSVDMVRLCDERDVPGNNIGFTRELFGITSSVSFSFRNTSNLL